MHTADPRDELSSQVDPLETGPQPLEASAHELPDLLARLVVHEVVRARVEPQPQRRARLLLRQPKVRDEVHGARGRGMARGEPKDATEKSAP